MRGKMKRFGITAGLLLQDGAKGGSYAEDRVIPLEESDLVNVSLNYDLTASVNDTIGGGFAFREAGYALEVTSNPPWCLG
jgi:hypothetical protein